MIGQAEIFWHRIYFDQPPVEKPEQESCDLVEKIGQKDPVQKHQNLLFSKFFKQFHAANLQINIAVY